MSILINSTENCSGYRFIIFCMKLYTYMSQKRQYLIVYNRVLASPFQFGQLQFLLVNKYTYTTIILFTNKYIQMIYIYIYKTNIYTNSQYSVGHVGIVKFNIRFLVFHIYVR